MQPRNKWEKKYNSYLRNRSQRHIVHVERVRRGLQHGHQLMPRIADRGRNHLLHRSHLLLNDFAVLIP